MNSANNRKGMKLAVMALVFTAITAGAETGNNLDVSAGINHEEFAVLGQDLQVGRNGGIIPPLHEIVRPA
ncbi:MAG TPA: hypothetical protein VJ420_12185 [Candidatus Udaeobacter sp.]|nr:hypothetical protein [Candidatus Udaeobacter sp.]